MLKDIVVNVGLQDGDEFIENYAIATAAQLGANLTGIVLRVRPVITGPAIGFLSNDAMQLALQKLDETAHAAAERFSKGTSAAGVVGRCHTPAVTFVEATQRLVQVARCNDLAIMGQPRPQSPTAEGLFIEAVLFHSGRPILIVPYIQRDGPKFERITVCWDGSKAAARAIADAMPLLVKAKKVDLLTFVGEWAPGTVFEAADMAVHLARHNVPLEVAALPTAGLDVGNSILNFATDNGSHLIVMGGYGHAKFGEAIFGGATRTLLQSMTVPTLMSN